MDILAELESMADNVASAQTDTTRSDIDIERWQRLFSYTRSEATQAIETHRNDFARAKISDDLWEAIRPSKEAAGFDRESYGYSLLQERSVTTKSATACTESGTFVVQLAGPLNCTKVIQEAAQLNWAPQLKTGVGEHGQTQFCEIDGLAKGRLLAWLAKHRPSFRPTIVRLGKAKKDLCSYTLAPILGVETTFPQYRALMDDFTPLPRQDQYPVWYFFYGTLADPQILRQHLGLDHEPSFLPAQVCGGQIRTWAGKYKALVDASVESKVCGSAFLVETREQEDALRFYETDKYDVVRCRIIYEYGILNGLTFRFNGITDPREERNTVKPKRFCTRGKRGGKKNQGT
ncbi:hypothetical protein LTR10_020050 [Elasticomyces elasticus]|uniref:Gamma-glutamylcyclotransferase AIG2-like domain-containing protein n=1 Tax=Exophiala sideris TaxID=1016849 RepID=A0ABR0JN69_9EURO|nr:hypothetical protein LTR10_020050 [Elasticomyces elasticus]KAK5037876.1 hypothetical protein LTS07_001343 [Exophiala sideris]KAK5043859.1 hypothetical protein LTR13_000213 [Exophiala sideris]KAK5067358.1 hypothetical protein LTR69_001345 [Exophiala sideris]KAK5182691.1 hypothetical protein LTR44_005082 [Eurotiomycetes sp. CCFEE 6388]